MEYDKSYQPTGKMAYARILVHMDTRGGLQEHITIQWRTYTWQHLLDYEGVPYRSRRCHKVGHIYRDCPLNKKAGKRSNEKELGTPNPQIQSQTAMEVE